MVAPQPEKDQEEEKKDVVLPVQPKPVKEKNNKNNSFVNYSVSKVILSNSNIKNPPEEQKLNFGSENSNLSD